MNAGLNCSVDFIRFQYLDDDVGGSYPSGTYLHRSIDARIQEEPTRTEFLQQGLETRKIFSAMFWGHNLQFREQDEVIIVSPPNHEYYNKRFRVVTHQSPNNHPSQKRNYHLAKLERSQVAHKEEFQ